MLKRSSLAAFAAACLAVAQALAAPLAVVERRVGDDEVGAQIGVCVGVEGIAPLRTEVAFDATDGTVTFAIDQQPYLQGYLPVVLLANYVRYGVIPSNDINSGPGFITKDNIALVEKLAGEYR